VAKVSFSIGQPGSVALRLAVPEHVTIHDDWRHVVQHPGGEFGDDSSTTDALVRDGDDQDTVNAGQFEVSVDTSAMTYNVAIPVRPNGTRPLLTITNTKTSTAADAGTPAPPTPTKVPFGKLAIPTLKGVMTAAVIKHAVRQEFRRDNGEIHFDSGWKPVDQAVENWPKEKAELKIRVQYWLDGLVPG
jgi:hypothetical protein